MNPSRISILGIDGSGKSSTTLRAITALGQQFSICKTGRNPCSISKGHLSYCVPKTARFFEGLFKRVDATKNRRWIGLIRLFFVLFQGWLEPYMVRVYNPDVIMTTRCMIIDSAIYSDFYYPVVSRRMTTQSKLKVAQRCSRLPFRDLYFLLDTPIQMAMERIYKRISQDHPERTFGRDYWLHLHEHEDTLRLLDQKFRKTLPVAQRMGSFKVIEVDTSSRNEEGVAQSISEYSRAFCEGNSFEWWKRI
jgi:thymidylate kinase